MSILPISQWIDDYADETGEILYCMEPRELYDCAIIGVADGQIVYDRRAVISLLCDNSEMTYEDAVEFHYFNQDSMQTWLFLDRPEIPEIDGYDTTFGPVCDPSLN